MDAELAPLLAEHHRHAAAGGATSRKANGFDALIEDLASAGDRLAQRGPTLAKATTLDFGKRPAARPVLAELESLAKAQEAVAQRARAERAAARSAHLGRMRETFAKADSAFRELIAGGKITAVEAAKAEARMARFAQALR